MKKLVFSLIVFSLLSNCLNAQNESTSYVDMNPDELKSLISKLVVAKRQKMSYQQYLMYRQIQMHKKKTIYKRRRSTTQNQANTTPSTNFSDQQSENIERMLTELQRKQATPRNDNSEFNRRELNKMKADILSEINKLKTDIGSIPNQETKEPIIVRAPENNSENVELYEQLAKNMNEMNRSINAMEQKIASTSPSKNDTRVLEKQMTDMSRSIQNLENKLNKSQGTTDTKQFEKELRDIKNMIAEIDKTKSTHTKETIQTNTISNNTNTNYDYLNGVIKGRETSQILFANASHTLTEDAKNTIRYIANLLKQDDRLDVLIAGYTSSKGSPLYNQELSLRRTETVKRFLMELGVHATHIFSEYHGIDYNATDDSNARRVDVKILVRK